MNDPSPPGRRRSASQAYRNRPHRSPRSRRPRRHLSRRATASPGPVPQAASGGAARRPGGDGPAVQAAAPGLRAVGKLPALAMPISAAVHPAAGSDGGGRTGPGGRGAVPGAGAGGDGPGEPGPRLHHHPSPQRAEGGSCVQRGREAELKLCALLLGRAAPGAASGAQPVGWDSWIRWEMLGPRSTVSCTVQYRSAASRIARCTASVPPVVSHSWVSSKP